MTRQQRLAAIIAESNPVRGRGYSAAVIADSPLFYWRFDEASGTTANDSSGQSHPGTYRSGDTLGQPGALSFNAAVATDGTTNCNIFSQGSFSGPPALSLETWFKTTTTSGGLLLGHGSLQTGSSPDSDTMLYMTNDGHLTWGVYNGAVRSAISAAAYNDGAWHCAVAAQGASGMVLSVDGASVATNPATTNSSQAGYWRVAGDDLTNWPGSHTSSYFAGTVDETAVYLYALSSTQVAAHFAAAFA